MAKGDTGKVALALSWGVLFSMAFVVQAAPYRNITVEEGQRLIRNENRLYILDVRTQMEYDEGHIDGAHLIPHTNISVKTGCTPCGTAVWGPNPKLPSNKDTPMLVYCGIGVRSAGASEILDGYEYTNVSNMLGGFVEWKAAGLPYVASEGYLALMGLTIVRVYVYRRFHHL